MALGTFDGVHLGHQAVIRQMVARAKAQQAISLVATFDRHPAAVLAPHRAPLLIQSLAQRLHAFARLRVEATWLIPFDLAFSQITGEDFVRTVHADFPKLHTVFVGDRFRFGHRRAGSVGLLRRLGAQLGFAVEAVPPVCLNDAPVSSTRVRQEIAAGRLGEVRALLGRPYALAGTVVRGERLGRQLGFPTANLHAEGLALPPQGVYVAHATLPVWSGPAVANIGVRPTLGRAGAALRIEAHLIGFDGEAYGLELELVPLAFLRPEQSFVTLGALREQIAADRAMALAQYPVLWQATELERSGGGPLEPAGYGKATNRSA